MRRLLTALALLLALCPAPARAQEHNTSAIKRLREMLVAHDWDGIHESLEQRRIRSDAESQFEFRYVFAFDAFTSADSALQRHLDAWVEARPDVSHPRAARGLYFVHMAAAAERHGPTDRASDPAAREQARWLALAGADARAAIRIDSGDVMGHAVLLAMVPLEKRSLQSRRALEATTARRPATLHHRMQYVEQLVPRNGNPPERMVQFADSAQRFASVNPRLRVLLGMPEFERGSHAAWSKDHSTAIAAFTRALSFGDYWRYRYERGMEYFRIDSLAKALTDLNRAIAERPGYVPALAHRAVVLARLAKLQPDGEAMARRAQADMALAYRLDKKDENVVYLLGAGGGPRPVAAAASAERDVEGPRSDATEGPVRLLGLRQMLLERDFTRLDSALAARAREARARPALEGRYLYAYDVFDSPDSAVLANLEAWVTRHPRSAIARSARAKHYLARGRNARTNASGDKVTDAQRQEMREWMALAVTDAVDASKLDTTDIAPHQVLIDAARFVSHDAMGVRVLHDALKRQPASVATRMRFMVSLLPRWGGSLEELERFAEREQTAAKLNPEMTVLRGMADFERGDDLASDSQHSAAVAAYTRALSHGDYWWYRFRRARAYLRLKEPEKALADLDLAVAQRPGLAYLLAWRAYACLELANVHREDRYRTVFLNRGRDDYRLALLFDAGDSDVQQVVRTYPILSPTRTP